MSSSERRLSGVLNKDAPSELKVDARVEVQGKSGTVRFVGTTSFQTGKWVGIELDTPNGKNSGVVQGKRYFECKTNHGVFVRPSQVKLLSTEDDPLTSSPTPQPGRGSPRTGTTADSLRSASRKTPSPSSTLLPSRIATAGRTAKTPSTSPSTPRRTPLTSARNTPSPSMTSVRRKRSSSVASKNDSARMSRDMSTIAGKSDGIEEELTEEEYTGTELDTPDEEGPATPVEVVSGVQPATRSDQVVPLKDYEELRMKLKILETKRQEDRERHRENEKIKEEAEQFLTLRAKLQEKVAELQQDLRETKKQVKELTSENEQLENKYNDAIEAMEMMTLDKEMAEERAENLQQEVNVLKDKIEEISVDLEVFKKEGDLLSRASEVDGDGKPTVEVLQLEKQNERLKEALVRLRDVTTEQEAELDRKIKSLEKDSIQLEELKVQHEIIKEKLDLAENQIEDLKIRLDDVIGAEDLAVQLTEKNLNLNEKIEDLRATVEDLEALKELADELEENHMETEKQLQAEIDHRDMLLRGQMERLASAEETNADYENTISQFRELVLNLQNDLEQLRHREESQLSESRNLSSQSQAMMSLNLQLRSTVMKSQAKAIDLELRKLDATQATERLTYVQAYLPDSFFKTENDPISCLLLFKRLSFKSKLILKHLDQSNPISDLLNDRIPETLTSVCDMRQKLGWLEDLSKRFVSHIEISSVQEFLKFGQVYHDLVGTERRLNGIVELLRSEELRESECITNIQRMIAQLEHLSEVYLTPSDTASAEYFFGLTRALDHNTDTIIVSVNYLKQLMQSANASEEDGFTVSEGWEKLEYDFIEPITRLSTHGRTSKTSIKKLLRRLEDLSEQALTLRPEYLANFKDMYTKSSHIAQLCIQVFNEVSQIVQQKRDSKEPVSLAVIQQLLYNKTDEILEFSENSMFEGTISKLNGLCNDLNTTVDRVAEDSKAIKIATASSPWLQRASDLKAEVVVNHDMERKLQQHNDEILKLIKDVKMKDQSLQESAVKIELLEKRMEGVKKQGEQIGELESGLAKSQSQMQMYAEAMENLQAEYDTLEQENIQLKKAAAKRSEKQTSTSKSTDFPEGNNSTSEEIITTESYAMKTQLDSLKNALRYLRAENAHLKSKEYMKILNLDALPDLPATDASENVTTQNTLRSIALESKALIRDIRSVSAASKVVRLQPVQQGKWRSQKMNAEYQYQQQQSVLHTLQMRSFELRHKVDSMQQSLPKRATVSEKPSDAPDSASYSLARIQIPKIPQLKSIQYVRKNINLSSFSEFEKVHSVFVR